MIAVGMGQNHDIDSGQAKRSGQVAVDELTVFRLSPVNHHDFPVTQNYGRIPLPHIQKMDLKRGQRRGAQHPYEH